MEEMREELSVAEKEDAEEVKKWRGLSQSEIDQSWKNWAERMEEEVLNKCKVGESKREVFRGRGAPLEWRRVHKKQEKQNKKVERRLLGTNLRLVQRQRVQLAATARQAGGVAEEEEMKQ